MSYYNKDAKDVKKYISNSNTSTPKFKYIVLIAAVGAVIVVTGICAFGFIKHNKTEDNALLRDPIGSTDITTTAPIGSTDITTTAPIGLTDIITTAPIQNNEIENDDQELDYTDFPNHSYQIIENSNISSFEEAEEYCQTIGGHLATIQSQEENDYIYSMMISEGYKSAYFGFTDRDIEGTWVWVNDEPVNYTNWAPSEPNSENSEENYAMFYYKFTDGTWNDGRWGSDTTAFICEWDKQLQSDSESPIIVFLDQLPIVESDRYTGNEGDSFVFQIGKHQYTRGNTCTDGETYEHGIEGWLARWNGSKEKSWAYATFNLNRNYSILRGECKLINSYNTSEFNTTLEFWNDDDLIQSYILTPDSIPFTIELDVSNCENLKVYFYDNEAASGGTSFGLINMELIS